MALADIQDALAEQYSSLSGRIPYFPYIFAAVLVVILAVAAFLVFSGPESVEVKVLVKNAAGAAVKGSQVAITGLPGELKLATDKDGGVSFNAPLGAAIEITVSKQNYSPSKKQFTVSRGILADFLLRQADADLAPKNVTLTFVGPDSRKLSGTLVNAHLSCSDSAAVLVQQDFEVTTGELKISPPGGCGHLIVAATAQGYMAANVEVLRTEQQISFQGMEKPKGSVQFTVTADDTNRFADGINVKLLDSAGIPAGFEGTSSFGEVSFAGVETGSYTALYEDPLGNYAGGSVQLVVQENSTVRKELRVSKDVKLRARIKVVESGGAAVAGAMAVIYGPEGAIAGQQLTGSDGAATILVKENGIYAYSASKGGYIGGDRNTFSTSFYTRGSEKEFTVRLRKCTPQICGTLRVRVLDENSAPVENARVSLLDSEGFVLTQYGSLATDFNGYTAAFQGVAAGTYMVLGQKFPAEARSSAFIVDASGQNSAELRVVIGSGTVNVKAIDIDNNPVAFAKADIYTETGAKIGTVALDASGKSVPLSVKADKRVYAVISKDGYAQYVTSSKQIYPGKALQFTAVMEQGIAGEKPSVEFMGVYSDAGTQVNSMKHGMMYYARFVLRVPSGGFDETGIFVRSGEKEDVETENIWVVASNAPRSVVVKGATYRPSSANGDEEETNDNAKWVNLRWNNSEEGKYEAEVELKVKNGITKGTRLPIYYRAWGVREARFLRDPVDNALGENEDSGQKKGLYAESYEKSFLEGIDELCTEQFCFNVRVLDLTSGIYIAEPFALKTYAPHRLEFSLTNNSATRHDDATLSIRDTVDMLKAAKEISINSYAIENASASRFSGSAPVFEIPKFSMGDFRQNKAVTGELGIEAKTLSASALEFTVVSGQNIAFNRAVAFTAAADTDINLEVSPLVVAAFEPIDLNVQARYNSGDNKGFGIEQARVVVRKIAPDRSEAVFTATTDGIGLARVRIPASSPGTRLVITVQKAGLGVKAVERIVSSSVAAFDPAQLAPALNRATNPEVRVPVSIENLVGRGLSIKRLRVSVPNNGLLDMEKMNNYLAQYIGTRIGGNSIASIDFLAALGDEARLLDAPAKARGSLLVELAVADDPAVSYVMELPLNATINLAEMPANAPCISISKNDWKDATLGSRAVLEFEVQDNCVASSGAKISFDNLQSAVHWTGSDGIIGQVELSVTDPVSGAVSSEILQQGLWTKLLNGLEPNVVYPARLTFVPKPDTLGKTAEFSVNIDSQLATNTGGEFVGANSAIDAEIVVANLDQCIQIEPQPEKGISIGRSETGAGFTVDTTKCGPVPLDIRFCGGPEGDYCRGGTNDGGLTLQPWGYNAVNQGSREVKVTRQEIPGFYGITVEARPSGGSWRQVAEIDTIVEPEEGEYFTMNRYNFTVIGKGTKDSAQLTNQMLQETVQVTANVCDWGDAQAGPNFTGSGVAMGMAGGIVVGYLASMAPAISALGASGIGAVVAVVIIVIMALLGDPCADDATHPLQDYVINLAGTVNDGNGRYIPPDALGIIMSDARIGGKWNVDITDAVQKTNKKFPNGKQIVGAVFENLNAIQDKPVFSIATMRAKEHVHGDATHQNAAVTCSSSDFGHFWLNPEVCGKRGEAFDTTYSQKFHLKFKVAEEKVSLPQVTFDTYACQSGIDIGRTGKGALPRVKLNWSWQEPNNGITYNQCDAGNPDYVYCDATQFTIELNKKLYSLYEFLAVNDWNLGCPELREEEKDAQDTLGSERVVNEIATARFGLADNSVSITGSTITIVATARNRTDVEQGIVVQNSLYSSAGEAGSCQMDIQGIPASGQKQGACTVPLPPNGTYFATSTVQGSTNNLNADVRAVRNGIYVGDPLKSAKNALCEVKSTETMFGEPQLLRFIDNKGSIRWTDKIPNRDALEKLLVFDAYLMKDNYSKEFFADFASHYTNDSFEDTEFYFNRLGQDSQGRNYGFNRLMEQEKFVFTRKYVAGSELPSAGLYRVEWAIYFSKEDWRFFDADGSPKMSVAVVVNRISDPYPASPFYSMPFDGLVGLKGNNYERGNYGVSYTLQDADGLVWVTSGRVPVKSYPGTSGNAVTKADVKVSSDVYSMNVSPATRGMILQVSKPSGKSADIVFQPSHATPVLMKATRDSLASEPFSVYYSMTENNNNVAIGNTLNYWDGAGTCADFTGIPVTEAFYQKPDRLIGGKDKLFEIKNAYATDWKQASKKGDVYLRTIFYTNPGKDYALKSQPLGIKNGFYTPDNSGSMVALNGIGGMENNSYSAGAGGTIASIDDALRMVANQKACLTNTGESVKIWWNPQAVYTVRGTQRNVSEMTNSLKAGETCIQ